MAMAMTIASFPGSLVRNSLPCDKEGGTSLLDPGCFRPSDIETTSDPNVSAACIDQLTTNLRYFHIISLDVVLQTWSHRVLVNRNRIELCWETNVFMRSTLPPLAGLQEVSQGSNSDIVTKVDGFGPLDSTLIS
jgi:hypothetical protein